MAAKRVKVIRIKGVELPEGKIPEYKDCYKSLGIPQTNRHHDEDTAKYISEVKTGAEKPVGRNKIQTVSACTLLVIRNPAGVILMLRQENSSQCLDGSILSPVPRGSMATDGEG